MYFTYLEGLGIEQNMVVSVSLMEYLLQIQGNFCGFFVWNLIFDNVF